jgi:hypothetical protein
VKPFTAAAIAFNFLLIVALLRGDLLWSGIFWLTVILLGSYRVIRDMGGQ